MNNDKYKNKFHQSYIIDPITGCWNWQGPFTSDGYGGFSFPELKITRAHRYSYWLANGFLNELFVCHQCDNTKCVNPNHLFLGTNQDNMDDMKAKGRSTKDTTLTQAHKDNISAGLQAAYDSGKRVGAQKDKKHTQAEKDAISAAMKAKYDNGERKSSITQETCIHCGTTSTSLNIKRWHNDNCKKSPNGRKSDPNFSKQMSDLRKSKTGEERGSYKQFTCPHCNFTGGGGNMKRYHFNNCDKFIS